MADEPDVVFGKWLVSLRRAVENPVQTLKRIGALVTSRTQQRFVTQESPEDGPWAPRMNPNIPGIISDLERGAAVKGRRWQDRPALVDNGSLRQSISWRLEGTDTTVIGTVDPHASIQQFGGPRSIPVTPKVKDGIRGMLKKFRRKERRHWAAAPGFMEDPTKLAFLLHTDTFEFKIIPRPFVGLSDQDEDDVLELIRSSFLGDALGSI